jgi:hypothetical protein
MGLFGGGEKKSSTQSTQEPKPGKGNQVMETEIQQGRRPPKIQGEDLESRHRPASQRIKGRGVHR